MYALEHIHSEPISAYMSRACRLFSGLHIIKFNTIENLFVIVNSNRSRFPALVDRFRSSDPKVVNADVDFLETLLRSIKSCSRVVDGPSTAKPYAISGSGPTTVPPPKADCRKTTAPSTCTRSC